MNILGHKLNIFLKNILLYFIDSRIIINKYKLKRYSLLEKMYWEFWGWFLHDFSIYLESFFHCITYGSIWGDIPEMLRHSLAPMSSIVSIHKFILRNYTSLTFGMFKRLRFNSWLIWILRVCKSNSFHNIIKIPEWWSASGLQLFWLVSRCLWVFSENDFIYHTINDRVYIF